MPERVALLLYSPGVFPRRIPAHLAVVAGALGGSPSGMTSASPPLARDERSGSAWGRRIAILIPCHNEESTIASVVRKFRRCLPSATVYVFDNNSSDRTAAEAARAGATVFHEGRQGKGFVVRSMFRKIDADVYVLIDGDDTYPADAVENLLAPVLSGEADMVIGSRLHKRSDSRFRYTNRFGNQFFSWLLSLMFGVRITDVLSGYRVFSRRFVRGVPLLGGGFETEAEMTIKALQRGFTVVEVPVDLTPRPPESRSKLRLVHDGLLILGMMLTLLRDYKPLTFFGSLGIGLMLVGLVPGTIALAAYVTTGIFSRPGAVWLASALVLTGLAMEFLGLILHTIARRFQELDLQLQTLADDRRSRTEGESSGR
jgi:hypothetical protein